MQYESLASAGIRAVETLGCHIKDCMTTLESNADAEAYPNRRIVLAQRYALSLLQISETIDRKMQSQEQNDNDLEELLQEIKEAA